MATAASSGGWGQWRSGRSARVPTSIFSARSGVPISTALSIFDHAFFGSLTIVENHQQPDGSVRVPKALQPLVGREVLEPVRR